MTDPNIPNPASRGWLRKLVDLFSQLGVKPVRLPMPPAFEGMLGLFCERPRKRFTKPQAAAAAYAAHKACAGTARRAPVAPTASGSDGGQTAGPEPAHFTRSIGFCAIRGCISSSSSSEPAPHEPPHTSPGPGARVPACPALGPGLHEGLTPPKPDRRSQHHAAPDLPAGRPIA